MLRFPSNRLGSIVVDGPIRSVVQTCHLALQGHCQVVSCANRKQVHLQIVNTRKHYMAPCSLIFHCVCRPLKLHKHISRMIQSVTIDLLLVTVVVWSFLNVRFVQ